MDDMTSSPYPPFNGVEPYGTVRSVADERAHRKRMCATLMAVPNLSTIRREYKNRDDAIRVVRERGI